MDRYCAVQSVLEGLSSFAIQVLSEIVLIRLEGQNRMLLTVRDQLC
jgi:hypothetical protein